MTTSELGLRSGQRNENVHNEPQSHFVPVEGGFVDRSAFEKYQTAQIAARMILAHSIILNQRQIMQITALDILHQEAIEEADARLVATVDLTIKTTYLEFLKSGNVIGKYKRPYRFTLNSIPEPLRKDRDVIRAALSINGLILGELSEMLRGDKELVLVAVSQNGLVLRFASALLRRDDDVIWAALKQNENALTHVKGYAWHRGREMCQKLYPPTLPTPPAFYEECRQCLESQRDNLPPGYLP